MSFGFVTTRFAVRASPSSLAPAPSASFLCFSCECYYDDDDDDGEDDDEDDDDDDERLHLMVK